MGSEKDRLSDPGDGEDIPSDFFDDFTRDEFMEGLSVIDSWDDEDGGGKRREMRRINMETIDSVKDLRELISDKEDTKQRTPNIKFEDKYKWRKQDHEGEGSSTSADNFTKPGSRRDPNKTNEAIKKDKEVKVKEYLAKHLESSDDLRPPGTELDDYFDGDKSKERKKSPKRVSEGVEPPPHRPAWTRKEPYRSPRRYSPRRVSPQRRRYSPHFRRSPPRYIRPRFSPHKHFRKRYSPPRHSPRRYSPSRPRAHSPPRRRRSSRSPVRRPYESRRSRSPRSRSPHKTDSFLYPNDPQGAPGYPLDNSMTYQPELGAVYSAPNEFSSVAPGYSYPQGMAYGTGFPAPYSYGTQPTMPGSVPVPGPLPLPTINPVPAPPLNAVPAPAMVPAPASTLPVLEQKTPYDALAQLVAEGKISQEDYLKLAPNKGVSSCLDSKTMTGVMSRCNEAIRKLEKLVLPNHLMMNNHIIGVEPKSLESKFCSPLKRQAVIEFNFTKTNGPTLAQQNKQLVESIITTIGLDKVVSRYKRKLRKDVKDAAVQTTKPYCDVCEIRESTKFHEVGTVVDPEHFSCTVHTQVVEHDLVNSKSVFNPTGSASEGAPISISHLTPAQLVSQLAARAKTLKQSSPVPPSMHQNQFGRRNPNYDYDGRGGGQQQYHHGYNQYRY
ncbi:uncharacterized protein LOC110372141 [Helicoverpa armigera]|uniref:uncharacterized protein LOC110372141 n=1 Tax=Helicoverpa armigera TaxID=29058 RepID=UPI0030833AA2